MLDYKKTYKLGIYGNYRVHIVVTDDLIASLKKYKIDVDDSISTCDGLFVYGQAHWQCYIFIRPDSELGSVAHEAFHATSHIMREIGGRLTDSSEESYAYLLGYLTTECMIVAKTYLDKEALLNKSKKKRK